MEKQVKKVHRLQDILISTGLLLLGLLFTFAVPSWSWLGISLLITAAFMLPFYKTGYVIKSQKGVFQKKEVLLPRECMAQIVDYVEGVTDTLDIDPFKMGGLLLEWYFKKDRSKQFGQLYDYENSTYNARSKMSELDDNKIQTLLKYQSNDNF